ncbi:MAG: ImmA/IrrE family metallo-endopeptidase [Vicinamibacteria bacterium]
MARTEALVNPTLLKWARETAGYTLGEAASRLSGVRDAEARLAVWERGGEDAPRPTLAQARKLAALYKRPLDVFFRAERPVEAAPPPDYRRRPGANERTLSPALRWHVRRLRNLRQAALDLAEGDPGAFAPFPVRASLDDDPADAAEKLREVLRVPLDVQLRWRSEEKAWNHWRRAVETGGCLVFVLDKLAAIELDGFSLAFDKAAVIAVNGNPEMSRGRRVFTLMHELAHVALHAEGLCSLDDRVARVEAFCNRVAAAILMPARAFREAAERLTAEGAWKDEALAELALTFSVSRQAVYVRLVSLGLAKQAQYDAWRTARTARVETAPGQEGQEEREGGPSFYQLYLYRMSFPYLRQVFEAYHADELSLAELSDHLGVKPATALALESRFLERLRTQAS